MRNYNTLKELPEIKQSNFKYNVINVLFTLSYDFSEALNAKDKD